VYSSVKHGGQQTRKRRSRRKPKIPANAKVLKQLLLEVTSFLSVGNSEPDQPAAEQIRQAYGQAGAKGLWKRKKLRRLESRIHK